jgi:hypothetical protein
MMTKSENRFWQLTMLQQAIAEHDAIQFDRIML